MQSDLLPNVTQAEQPTPLRLHRRGRRLMIRKDRTVRRRDRLILAELAKIAATSHHPSRMPTVWA